ncbi:uncharacterized protein LOC133330244 [Musca vetustissima]|uniref:uncharacterized protein LOC133330244 n=1 Tax=Musca vetustissima TaxID=27455 RepID=UPI002AB7E3E5|nr:uncharacterized protein LOC133330244 [Musca vetustissima]
MSIDIPKFVFVILLSSSLRTVSSNSKSYSYVSANAEYKHNFFSELKITARNGSMDIVVKTLKDFTSDPWVSVLVVMRPSKNAKNRTLLHYDINVCKILGKQATNFISTWLQNYFRLGNMPSECPIKKGNYSWCNLRPDMLKMPLFFSKGQYIAHTSLYFKKRKTMDSLANITTVMEVK